MKIKYLLPLFPFLSGCSQLSLACVENRIEPDFINAKLAGGCKQVFSTGECTLGEKKLPCEITFKEVK